MNGFLDGLRSVVQWLYDVTAIPILVYFTLIKTLERFSDRLREARVEHVCYHGDLDRQWRRRIQNEFMEGHCPLVLATNAFGMGIDKEDIRFVSHAEIPGSMESW